MSNSDLTPLANRQQLSHAANEINVSSCDPNSIPPSTPSSFFAPSAHPPPPPSVSSLLTSVSRTKCKSDSVVGSEEQSRKRSQPTLSAVLAQQASGATMHKVAEAVKDLSHSMAPPIDDIAKAVSLLGQHDKLSPLDILDISDYLASVANKNQVIVFCSLDFIIRKEWVQWRLVEIRSQHA
jgi:hypothetical protein